MMHTPAVCSHWVRWWSQTEQVRYRFPPLLLLFIVWLIMVY
jgi:hypothetical protein